MYSFIELNQIGLNSSSTSKIENHSVSQDLIPKLTKEQKSDTPL
jgi:hypothetical protein